MFCSLVRGGGKGILIMLLLAPQALQTWPKWSDLIRAIWGMSKAEPTTATVGTSLALAVKDSALSAQLYRELRVWQCQAQSTQGVGNLAHLIPFSAKKLHKSTSCTQEERESPCLPPHMTVSHAYIWDTISVFSGSYSRNQVFTANLLSEHIWWCL